MAITKIKVVFWTTALLLMICMLTGCDSNPGKTRAEKIHYLLEKAFKEHSFIGNALVAEKGQIVYKKSFGKENAKTDTPNSDSTKFLIASLSKPFTTILILKLVEQGKISLKDGLSKFFPETKGLKIGKVTIHHLLTHTSGIKEFITEIHVFKQTDLAGVDFIFDPGSSFEYSNSGYVLLKNIAEIASEKTYIELINQLIFKPLYMTSSGVAKDVTTIPNLAIGYKSATQQDPEKITYSLEIVDGAGSLFSTTSDMLKFTNGINSPKFLPKAMRDLMFTQHVKEKFGYGWYLRERSGIWDVAYHKGDLPGYTSFLSIKTTNNQMIVLLSNASSLDLDDLENDIAKIMKAKE